MTPATDVPNLLILRIQPEEGISLKFVSKRPGAGMTLRPVSMDFNYGASFGERSPSAYETLLLDAIIGDATLYTRQDMVEASWQRRAADSRLLERAEIFLPQLRGGHLGPGGGGRHARPPRPCLEDAVMATASQPIKPDDILKELSAYWTHLGADANATDHGNRSRYRKRWLAARLLDDADLFRR